MKPELLISIIIANYNKGDNIRSLLASIYDDCPFDDSEVIFMDDASTDASVTEAQNFPVRLFRETAQSGPATLRNRAARSAGGEYLLFIDSDAVIPKGSLSHVRELCLAGGFGALSGLEVLPPVIDNWVGWFRTLQVQDNFGGYRRTGGDIQAWGSTFGAVRRQLFLDSGGFDEAFKGADVEDHDLAVRLTGRERMIFSQHMTYRHSYPDTLDLVKKQFRRAAQMVQLGQGGLIGHSLLFRWHYKAGHVLSAAMVAGIPAAALNHALLPLPLAALVMKLCLNRYLFIQACREKGPLFMLYVLGMSVVTGVSIVSGAIYGRVRPRR